MVGNCQAAAVAEAMRLLRPEADVAYVPVHWIARRFPAMADLLAELADREVVFASTFGAPFRDGGDFETLRAATRLVQIPMIVFGAFHPDLVYVGDTSDPNLRQHVRSPVGDYNSALALYGFLADFTVGETLRLFRPEVMEALGYLDLWDESLKTQLSLGRDADYDLSADVMRWSRRGAFMHSVNHPRMFVACDLARGLLAKAGLPFAEFDLDSYAADTLLRGGNWPVYPPVAERYGVPGGYAFMVPATRRTPPRTMGLQAFVTESFRLYARRSRAELVAPRVETWRSDPAWRDALAGWAKG